MHFIITYSSERTWDLPDWDFVLSNEIIYEILENWILRQIAFLGIETVSIQIIVKTYFRCSNE